MKLIDRISLLLSDAENEEAEVCRKIEEYILSIEKPPEKKISLLIVSTEIERVLKEEIPQQEQLSVEERKNSIIVLNKRLSQINNTREKVEFVIQKIIEYFSQSIPQDKIGSFADVIVERIQGQVKAQVAANKGSAIGYALFLIEVSKYIPDIIYRYRRSMYRTMTSIECICGMYRVYFLILKMTANIQEALLFIFSLLEYVEDITHTFNPFVLTVFMEEMGEDLRRIVPEEWANLKKKVIDEYLPILDKKVFASNISCIKNTFSK